MAGSWREIFAQKAKGTRKNVMNITFSWLRCGNSANKLTLMGCEGVRGYLSPGAKKPLEAGRNWQTKYFFTDKVIHPDWSGSSWKEWTVEAWEEVTVPAGTFMAYKIVRTKTKWETTSEDVAINWYAPEIPGFVKGAWHRGSKDGYGPAEHMWEVVSVDLKEM